MKKLLMLCAFTILFFVNCKDQNTPQAQQPQETIGLEKLTCDGKSILKKLNNRLFCDFGKVEKYSVELVAKPINAEIVDINVTVNSVEVGGSNYLYNCSLSDGVNNLKVTLTSKKDSSVKKEYRIRITKSNPSFSNTEGSKIKEIKVDDVDILSKFNKKHTCELSDVEQIKSEVSLYVLPYNSSAIVTVSNNGKTLEKISANTYKVALDYGTNDIHILIKSEKEGELLYKIGIYRKEELGLKSFKVVDIEYCDENTGTLKTKYVKFDTETSKVKVSVQAKNANATLSFKQNGREIIPQEGFYNLDLEPGTNGIEIKISGKDINRSKIYEILFIRTSPTSSGIIKLDADGDDLIHLLSSSNSITLNPRDNENSSLKLEVLVTSNLTVRVKHETTEISGTNGVYNINLKEGNNKIEVILYEGATSSETYSIFVKRHIKLEDAKTPESDEVEVTFVLSDGVNGSSVDGSYINIAKTQNPTAETNKHILVKNGKIKTNLKKNTFYDFKVEGRNDEYATKKYVASDIISYYIGDKSKVIHIVQRPMQRITKKAIAPTIDTLSFGSDSVIAGTTISSDSMKQITMKITTEAPIEKLDRSSPLPMLAIGFVPSTDEDENSGVQKPIMVKDSEKTGDKWTSTWTWNNDHPLIKIEDVVIVVYDVASNRLEYHLRIQPTSAMYTEDDTISITDMSLQFRRLPTPSQIYSVGEDEGTKNSSHYTSDVSFDAKRNGSSVALKGFDLYRKCIEDGGDFALVKHVLYKSSKIATEYKKHQAADTNGCLEDEKTYQYKVVAYTHDNKKSKLEKSNDVSVKVPKSSSLLLEYPVKQAITETEAKNINYVFKFSNPNILKDATEIRLGFLISERAGKVLHGSKFKYVFNDPSNAGKPEIYFARRSDAVVRNNYYYHTNYSMKRSNVTNKTVEELINVDQEKGIVTIKSDFFTLAPINIVGQSTVTYKKGMAYYWDIVDYGIEPNVDYDDRPCRILHEPSNNVKIISSVNDERNGNNAWNGRAEFNVRFD